MAIRVFTLKQAEAAAITCGFTTQFDGQFLIVSQGGYECAIEVKQPENEIALSRLRTAMDHILITKLLNYHAKVV